MKKIKRMIKNIVRDTLRFFLTPRLYNKLRFYLVHGYKLNLDNPKTWNEKIQYRKINCDPVYFSKFVDKLTVREYIKETIGEEYLIPLLGYYEKITPEDIEKLPNSFVIKTSNGGGGENVKIIRDKNNIDVEKLCNQFNKYLKIKIGSKIDELYYDIQKPHIIAEKLMLDEEGGVPSDYKFQVFNEKLETKILIQVDKSRFGNHQRSIYDENFKKLDLQFQPKYSFIDEELKQPQNFSKMIEITKKLSGSFKYVRIDLYNIKGQVYFGEITLCHGSGWEKIEPQEWDYKMGEMWELEK